MSAEGFPLSALLDFGDFRNSTGWPGDPLSLSLTKLSVFMETLRR